MNQFSRQRYQKKGRICVRCTPNFSSIGLVIPKTQNFCFMKTKLSSRGSRRCQNFYYRGDSAVLDRRKPWANRLFLKSMRGNILNILHEVEKMISVISVQVYSKKLNFPSLKKIDLIFKKQK